MHYLPFSDWIISLSTMPSNFTCLVLVCIRISFTFRAQLYYIVHIHHHQFVYPLMVIWNFDCFNFLTAINNELILLLFTLPSLEPPEPFCVAMVSGHFCLALDFRENFRENQFFCNFVSVRAHM